MIDHLTPYEGIIFSGFITIGLIFMIGDGATTQFTGGILLSAGFWGGIITLTRSLMRKQPGSMYLLCFVGALIAGLVKFFVFPDLGQNGGNRVIWAFIIGIGITGIAGVASNALIRAPLESPDAALNQATSQIPKANPGNTTSPEHGEDLGKDELPES